MKTIIEIVRLYQIKEEKKGITNTQIHSPETLGEIAIDFIGNEDEETLLVIGLDSKHKINVIDRISVGSLEPNIILREVFKPLILHDCSAFAISHPQPNEQLKPSLEDLYITRRIQKSGDTLGIRLIDHVIVNERNFLSLRKKGFLDG